MNLTLGQMNKDKMEQIMYNSELDEMTKITVDSLMEPLYRAMSSYPGSQKIFRG